MKRSERPSNRRRYSESVSRHYNRSRIERELNNFFDSFDDEDDDNGFHIDNIKEEKHENNDPTLPAVITPLANINNKMEAGEDDCINNKEEKKSNRDSRFDHLMDPEFDPIKDRCDSDAFLFSDENNNQVAHESQRKLRMQQWYDAETQLGKLPFIQKRVPITEDVEDERLEIRNQVSLLLEDQEDQDKENEDTKLQASETIQRDAEKISSQIEYQEKQDVEQGSIIDGFSVIEPSDTPQKQALVSYATNQFEELPGLIMLSMSSSDTHCEEATLSSKSNISYDDTLTITPSIAFFLNPNKQGLRNDSSAQRWSPPPMSQTHRPCHDIISNLKNIDIVEDDESHTVKGYSRGSSKFTTDSPKILELRERKRTIERRMERIAAKYPALIEVDKYF